VIVYDFTQTRERAGPEQFLEKDIAVTYKQTPTPDTMLFSKIRRVD
jgi:hypothetical protein